MNPKLPTVAPTFAELSAVSPALARYTTQTLLGDVWNRPGLGARDRSVMTMAALIARNHTVEMPYHFNLALENGVTPAELSETITHLAFYAGWATATASVVVAHEVLLQRGVDFSTLPPSRPELLPLDNDAEAKRAAAVEANVGPVSPGVVKYTGDLLFRDLWLRPGLKPRDRSLITVAALIANGQVAQIPFHLNRAMDNGLTRDEASEMLTHLEFYVGWPNAMSAVPVFKGVFESRDKDA